MLRVGFAVGLTVALMALAAAQPAVAEPRGRDVSLEAVVELRPAATPSARGIVRLSADPNGASQARTIVLGLVPVVQAARIVLTKASCEQVTAQPLDLNLLGLVVATSEVEASTGTAHAEAQNTFDANDLRRARAVAVVGDWNGDGRDDVAACGDVHRHGVAWDGARSDRNLFAAAETLGDAFGGARFLAYGRVQPDGGDRLRAVFTDLAPSTRHLVGISRQLCIDVWEHAYTSVGLARFETDARGSAALHPGGVNAMLGDGSVRFARSLVLTSGPGEDAEVVGCASLRHGTVVGEPNRSSAR